MINIHEFHTVVVSSVRDGAVKLSFHGPYNVKKYIRSAVLTQEVAAVRGPTKFHL